MYKHVITWNGDCCDLSLPHLASHLMYWLFSWYLTLVSTTLKYCACTGFTSPVHCGTCVLMYVVVVHSYSLVQCMFADVSVSV